MQVLVNFNNDKGVPVVTILSENEAEETTLNLLAACDDIKFVLEIDEDLIFKEMRAGTGER